MTQSYDKKPLHQQKCQKGKVTTQTTPQKSTNIATMYITFSQSTNYNFNFRAFHLYTA